MAVTASVFASQREEVLAAGLDDFLRKPYRSGQVFECMARHLGVRYLYAREPQAPVADLPALLRPDDLSVLPAALRNDLENAIISLDPNRISLAVSEISQKNTALGNTIARLADKMAYSPILYALRTCKSGSAKAQV